MSLGVTPPTNVLHLTVKKMLTLLNEVTQYKEELIAYHIALDDEFELMRGSTNDEFLLWRQKRQLEFVNKWEPAYLRLAKVKAFL